MREAEGRGSHLAELALHGRQLLPVPPRRQGQRGALLPGVEVEVQVVVQVHVHVQEQVEMEVQVQVEVQV